MRAHHLSAGQLLLPPAGTRPSHRSAGSRVCRSCKSVCATLVSVCHTYPCVPHLHIYNLAHFILVCLCAKLFLCCTNWLLQESTLSTIVANSIGSSVAQLCGAVWCSVVFIIRRWSRLRRDKSAGLLDSGLATTSIPLNKVILFHHCSHPTPSNISYELYYCRTWGVIAP